MKVSCEQSELLRALNAAQGAVSSRATIPVLANVLIEAGSAGMELAATDLELAVRIKMQAEVLQPGALSVPAKKLMDFVKELPPCKVELTSNSEGRLTLRAKKARLTISGIEKDRFPVLPVVTSDKNLTLSRDLLKEMIRKTSFAVSNDETRYTLNGVFFQVEKGQIRMVATDGRRLAYINCAEQKGIEKKAGFSVIIPTKAALEFQRIFSDPEIKMTIGENQLSFESSGLVMISRLIDGNFPNYEQVIPKDCPIRMKAKTQPLLECTRRVAQVNQDRSASIRLSLMPGRLVLSSNAQGIGEAEDEMEVEYKGDRIEVAYNPNFMMEALKNADSDEVTIEMSSAVNPGVIRPASSKSGTDYLCVIMPMRL